METLPALPRLPNGELDGSKICPPCQRCCKHVGIGIDPPNTVVRVSRALWLLYHPSVSMYQNEEGEWFMEVETTCSHLTPEGLCGVYENRPLICREYEIETCEGTSDEPAEKVKIVSGKELMKWLVREKPALYQKCLDRGIVPPEIRVGKATPSATVYLPSFSG